MKRIVFLIILFGTFFEVKAQNKAIDTVWFRVHRVTVVDAGLLNGDTYKAGIKVTNL